jgi:hypothetical protein
MFAARVLFVLPVCGLATIYLIPYSLHGAYYYSWSSHRGLCVLRVFIPDPGVLDVQVHWEAEWMSCTT